MTFRLRQSAGLLGLLFVIPLPGMAWLCLGRTPSAYSPANTPFWETRAPRPAPARLTYLLSFPEPVPTTEQSMALSQASESNPKFEAGDWLEKASPCIGDDAGLGEKAHRIAIRLLSQQNSDGYLGTPPPIQNLILRDTPSHCRGVRGLIAYYRATGFTPAIYGAMRGGDWLRECPEGGQDAASIGPLTALYRETGEKKYLARAISDHARLGGRADGLSLCALFEATGEHRFLAQAQQAWRHDPDPALGESLLRLAGAVPIATPRLARQSPRLPRRHWPGVPVPEHPASTWRSVGKPS